MAEDVNVENCQNFFFEAEVEMQYIKRFINCAEGYLTLQLIIRTVATVYDGANRKRTELELGISPERRDSKC